MGEARGGGLRVLIVEDEMMVAMLLEDMLDELGHTVVAVASDVGAAIEKARTLDLDVAILDLNLNGQESFPVARMLRERGVPFLFATGYGQGKASAEFAQVPTLPKPFVSADLERTLGLLLARAQVEAPST